jgi:hypothetical protein
LEKAAERQRVSYWPEKLSPIPIGFNADRDSGSFCGCRLAKDGRAGDSSDFENSFLNLFFLVKMDKSHNVYSICLFTHSRPW